MCTPEVRGSFCGTRRISIADRGVFHPQTLENRKAVVDITFVVLNKNRRKDYRRDESRLFER